MSSEKEAAPLHWFWRVILIAFFGLAGLAVLVVAVPAIGIARILICNCFYGAETEAALAAGPPDTVLPGATSAVTPKGQIFWFACRRFSSGEVRQVAVGNQLGTLIIVPGGDCRGGVELPKPPTYAVYWAVSIATDTSVPRIGAIDVEGCNLWKHDPRDSIWTHPDYAACWQKPTCAMTISTENLAGVAEVLRELLDDLEISLALKTAARPIAEALVVPKQETPRWLPPSILDNVNRAWVNKGDPTDYALCGWEAAAKVTVPFPPTAASPPS